MGHVVVAATSKGICAIELVSAPKDAASVLTRRFPKANVVSNGSIPKGWLDAAVRLVESGDGSLPPIDPQGTPFQHVVWKALKKVPSGQTELSR
ncbi:MAG: hypothetical protein O2910_07595 [Proteobacteria bacterium]|nr:hypothetical protein [Pseudomonadota bacterium]